MYILYSQNEYINKDLFLLYGLLKKKNWNVYKYQKKCEHEFVRQTSPLAEEQNEESKSSIELDNYFNGDIKLFREGYKCINNYYNMLKKYKNIFL